MAVCTRTVANMIYYVARQSNLKNENSHCIHVVVSLAQVNWAQQVRPRAVDARNPTKGAISISQSASFLSAVLELGLILWYPTFLQRNVMLHH